MKREIKFRGLRTDGKGWVYGSLVVHNQLECSIIDYASYEKESYNWQDVIPESVGQYTGLKDRNGKDIYDGDLLKIQTYNMTVKFIEGCFYAINENNNLRVTFSNSIVEITGNIHEQK